MGKEEKEEEAVKHTTSKRGISRGKRPALQTRGNHFKERLCDKAEEVTVEHRDVDYAPPVT